jgi:hypothetical protein
VIVTIPLPHQFERDRTGLNLGFFTGAFAPRDRSKRLLRLAARLVMSLLPCSGAASSINPRLKIFDFDHDERVVGEVIFSL